MSVVGKNNDIYVESGRNRLQSAETQQVKIRNRRQYLTMWILPSAVIGGWFYPKLGYLLPICLIAAIGIALFKGRYWCDWMCPRGATWDLFLSKLSLKNGSINRRGGGQLWVTGTA